MSMGEILEVAQLTLSLLLGRNWPIYNSQPGSTFEHTLTTSLSINQFICLEGNLDSELKSASLCSPPPHSSLILYDPRPLPISVRQAGSASLQQTLPKTQGRHSGCDVRSEHCL